MSILDLMKIRGQLFFWLYLKFFKIVLGIVILSGLIRFLIYVAVIQHQITDLLIIDLLTTFLLGLRFDLMAWGFIGLFLYIMCWLCLPISEVNYVMLYRRSIGLFWFLWGFAWVYEVNNYIQHNQHIQFSFLKTPVEEILALNRWPIWICVSVFFLGLYYFKKYQWIYQPEFAWTFKKTVVFHILLILLLGTIARGNWSARHLNADFANHSEHALINQLALNPWL